VRSSYYMSVSQWVEDDIKQSSSVKPYIHILTGSWANIESNKFWAVLGIFIIKSHYNGYSCK
jgi:hypothetical protein